MKKIVMTFAALLCTGMVSLFAQSSSTPQTKGSKEVATPTEKMVKIEANELPTPVQDTLNITEDTDLEKYSLYRNETSDEFMVCIATPHKPWLAYFYFDRNGKPLRPEED